MSVSLTNFQNDHVLIPVEGIDGSGKSGLCSKLQKFWTDHLGKHLPCYRQPGGTPLGESLRRLLSEKYSEIDPYTRYMIMETSRVNLVREILSLRRQAEQRGEFFDCIFDRHVESSRVYQRLDGVNSEFIEDIQFSLYKGHRSDTKLVPNVTFVLDLDPKIAIERINNRPGAKTMYDNETELFFVAARNLYRNIVTVGKNKLSAPNGVCTNKYVLIDAGGTENDTYEQAVSFLKKIL